MDEMALHDNEGVTHWKASLRKTWTRRGRGKTKEVAIQQQCTGDEAKKFEWQLLEELQGYGDRAAEL